MMKMKINIMRRHLKKVFLHIILQKQKKSINSKNKIENCLCQINMLTTNQEILVDMTYHIEDKEAKEKIIRKIMEKSNKNILPLQNSYKFKV